MNSENQDEPNNLKVETLSSQSLNEENENENENEQNVQNENDINNQNEGSLQQDSQDNMNRGNGDDSNLKFQCKCGKFYSRNASLFNHIRIKHENKIVEWKVFDGMRKQGRPKKEQNSAAGQQAGGAMSNELIDPHLQRTLSKKEISQEIINGQRNQHFNGEYYKKNASFPSFEQGKNSEAQKSQKYSEDIHQKLSIEKRFQQYQAALQLPPQGAGFLYQLQNHLYPGHYYQDKLAEQQQQQMSLFLQQKHSQQFSGFLKELQEEKPRHSLSMDIILRFKDILIDANEEQLNEKEEIDHLIRLFNFQTSLFQKYKVDYELHRSQFEYFYIFLRYWMKFIKREKIDDIFKEYITFQFSKIVKVQIDQSSVMERLQKIYDDFENKLKNDSNSTNAKTTPLNASASAPNNGSTTANGPTLNSAPNESIELPALPFHHGYPLYPHYPPNRGQFYHGAPYPPNLHPSQSQLPSLMNPLSLPLPPENLYGNLPGGLPYPNSESDPTSHLYRQYYPPFPRASHLPYPSYLDGATLPKPQAGSVGTLPKPQAGAVGASSTGKSQAAYHQYLNNHAYDKKHTNEPLKESK